MEKDRMPTTLEEVRNMLIRYYPKEYVDNTMKKLAIELKIAEKNGEIKALNELARKIV